MLVANSLRELCENFAFFAVKKDFNAKFAKETRKDRRAKRSTRRQNQLAQCLPMKAGCILNSNMHNRSVHLPGEHPVTRGEDL